MNTLHRDHDLKPEGRCILKVDKVSQDGNHLMWLFIVKEGACQGSELKHYTPMIRPHLLNLRNLLEILGIEVIDGWMDIDLTELIDLIVGGLVHNGQITDFWPVEGNDDDPDRATVDNIIPFPRHRTSGSPAQCAQPRSA